MNWKECGRKRHSYALGLYQKFSSKEQSKTKKNPPSILLAFQQEFEIGTPRIDHRGVKVWRKLALSVDFLYTALLPLLSSFLLSFTDLYNMEYDFDLPVTNDPPNFHVILVISTSLLRGQSCQNKISPSSQDLDVVNMTTAGK